ncbi:MAG: iron ABC transporter permease [Candidatus Sumerlaeota bacterium]|nr:iron ABC transporter permease [Candidatus Sumerlaeota bacterium]
MALLTQKRFFLTLLLYAALALAALICAPGFGTADLDPLKTLRLWWEWRDGARPADVDILIYLRLPRVLLAFMAGAALALTGAVFQALLRNPLAEPYTLGVASGGSLGAVVCIFLPSLAARMGSDAAGHFLDMWVTGWGPFSGVQISSFVFSALTVVVIYWLARGRSRISTMGLLLAGVTLGLLSSAAILLVRYLSEPNLMVAMDRWLMGGLDVTGWSNVWPVLPFMVPGAAILLVQARRYDQMAFGEELASGRGVNVKRLQKLSFFGGSLLTASVVAVAGPVGFVGLIVPHAVRRLQGPDHRLLLPCSFLAGGTFLVLCDTLARTLFAPLELPVGILTSLLGGPFFLYLIVRRKK